MATILTTLGFDIFARDHGATKTMKGIGDQTDRASQKAAAMRKIMVASAVAIAAGLIKFGRSSVTAFAEAEEAQKQLGFAFQKFPALANSSQAALQKLNTALQKKTRFDDDAIASGQAMLAQFKLTGKQIEEITPLVLDYAARTGKDIPQAANDVGKALLGNAKALKNVGIFYKSTGDAGQDFTNITALLREKVGGFAALEGKSFSGRLAILKNQFGELQESVGSKIVPALSKLVSVGLGVVGVVDKLGPGMKVFVATMLIGAPAALLFGAAFFKIKSSVTAARIALIAFIGTAKGATLAMGGIGIALAALGIVFGVMAGKSAKMKQEVGDLREEFLASNGAITESIRLGKAKQLQDSGQADTAARLGIGLDLLTRAHLGEGDAIAEVNSILDGYIANQGEMGRAGRGVVSTQAKQATTARQLKKELAAGNITTAEAKRQAELLGGAQKGLGGETKTAEQKIAEANTELKKMTASMWAANTAALALSGSEIATEQAFDDATAAIKKNGKTLNLDTQAGRDNKTALNNLVASHETYIQSLIDSKAPAKDVIAATKEARDEFVRVAGPKGMGLPIKEAKKLADRYFDIPKDVETLIKQRDMARAQKAAEDYAKKHLGAIPNKVNTAIGQPGIQKAKVEARQYQKDHLAKIERRVPTTVTQPGIQKARVEAQQYQRNDLRKVERKLPTQVSQPGMHGSRREAQQYQQRDLRRIERRVRTDVSQPGMSGSRRQTQGFWGDLRAIKGRSIFLNFTSNARSLASKLGIKLARGGPIKGPGGGSDDQIPAWLSNGEFVVNARAAARNRKALELINSGKEGLPPSDDFGGSRWPRFAHGGPVSTRIAPMPAAARSMPGAWDRLRDSIMDRVKNSFLGKVAAKMKSLVDKIFSALHIGGGGGVVSAGPGWGPVFRAMMAHGARSFTTYPGHHPTMQRARDVTPHNWAMANAARRLSSVWYVIYRMRIASMTRANKAWLPYFPRNFRGDWRHVRHIHVALRDQGGMLPPGGFAYNGGSGPERILDARMTKKFDRAFNAGTPSASGGGNTTIIVNAPHYVGSHSDLARALVDMNRRGQLEVIKGR